MKLARVAQILFILAAAVGVFSFVRAAQNDQRFSNCQALCALRPTYAAMNRRVPDFELPDMKGEKVRFSSFLGGKPVVLNFWTKTCEPCLEEMPALQEMAGILDKEGVKLVTICTDDGPEEIKDTLEVVLGGQAPRFTILFDPDTTVVTDKFGTTLYPETWVVDGDGVIRLRVDGKRNWSSSLALEVIEMIGRPLGCPVEFGGGRLTRFAELCECAPLGRSCLSDAECCDPAASCVKGKCQMGGAPPPRGPRAPRAPVTAPGSPRAPTSAPGSSTPAAPTGAPSAAPPPPTAPAPSTAP